MINDYYENVYSTSQHLEELSSAMRGDENEGINNNDMNDSEPLSILCPIFNVNTEDYSSNDNSNEISFNLKEWLIIDSISGKYRAPRQNEFLLLLLENPRYSSYISWLNINQGIFKIHETERVATLWSKVKNRQTTGIMMYSTFARGIRFYYKSGLMIKTHKRHTFRFKLPINSLSSFS
jgi:hypothetical protein